jgi:hypothetical protein
MRAGSRRACAVSAEVLMRYALLAALVALGTTEAFSISDRPQTGDAPALLAAARAAIAGPSKTAITALAFKGESQRQNQYFGKMPEAKEFVPYTLEMRIKLPNQFVAIRRATEHATVIRSGFSGDTSLHRTILPDGQTSEWTGPDALRSQRQEFARLVLLMLMRADTPLPLTLQPDTAGNTLRFTGPDDFVAAVRLDPKTRLPLELKYAIKMVRTGESRDYTMTVDARQDVKGASLPASITTTALGRVTERLRFTSVDVNPPLSASDFSKTP